MVCNAFHITPNSFNDVKTGLEFGHGKAFILHAIHLCKNGFLLLRPYAFFIQFMDSNVMFCQKVDKKCHHFEQSGAILLIP